MPAQALIEMIEAAFCGVTLGNGPSIRETSVIDRYGTDTERQQARALDTTSRWQDVTSELIESHIGTFSFGDRESHRFYLPALMTYAIRNWRHSESLAVDFTIYALDRCDGGWSLLNEAQVSTVIAFLDYMSTGTKCDTVAAQSALAKWRLRKG